MSACKRSMEEGAALSGSSDSEEEGICQEGTQEPESCKDKLHAQAQPEVRPCLAGKRTLLLEEMAAAVGFPQHRLLGHLLRCGCPIFGAFPRWGVFQDKVTAGTKSLREVLASSKWVKHAVVGRAGPSGRLTYSCSCH